MHGRSTSSGSQGLFGQSYLIYDPTNNDMYVAGGGPYNPNQTPQTIEIVSPSLVLLQTLNIQGVPFQLTFDPANNLVYAGVPQTGSPPFNTMIPVSS